MSPSRWQLVTFEQNVVRRRSLRGDEQSRVVLPPGNVIDSLCVSRASPHAAATIAHQSAVAHLNFASQSVEWLEAPSAAVRLAEVTSEGCAAVDRGGAVSLLGRGTSASLAQTVALTVHAGVLVVSQALPDGRCMVRRLAEPTNAFAYAGGERYPVLLGLAAVDDSTFVTQLLEGKGPPWVAVVSRGGATRRIARAWFGADQSLVVDGGLLHFPGFKGRRLQRLELREGAAPAPVFAGGETHALSGDGTLALCFDGESEVMGGDRVGRVYLVRDVATGETVERVVLYAGEVPGQWMSSAR